jgi:hypothetical protein
MTDSDFRMYQFRRYCRPTQIAWLIPSRERPDRCFRTINSGLQTSGLHREHFYLGVDLDDPRRDEYVKLANDLGTRVHLIDIPGFKPGFQGLGTCFNHLALQACSSQQLLGMLGDDMVFQTQDWDRSIYNMFDTQKDPWLCLGLNDGMQTERCVHPVINSEFVFMAGYYSCTDYMVDGIDTELEDVYKQAGRYTYLPDVQIYHQHWRLGCMGADAVTTNRVQYDKWKPGVRQLFNNRAAIRAKLAFGITQQIEAYNDYINIMQRKTSGDQKPNTTTKPKKSGIRL